MVVSKHKKPWWNPQTNPSAIQWLVVGFGGAVLVVWFRCCSGGCGEKRKVQERSSGGGEVAWLWWAEGSDAWSVGGGWQLWSDAWDDGDKISIHLFFKA